MTWGDFSALWIAGGIVLLGLLSLALLRWGAPDNPPGWKESQARREAQRRSDEEKYEGEETQG